MMSKFKLEQFDHFYFKLLKKEKIIKNETSVGSQFVEDWKKLYQRLSENLKKNKINYLEENVSSDKKIFGGKSSLFVSPKIKFSGSSVKFFGS